MSVCGLGKHRDMWGTVVVGRGQQGSVLHHMLCTRVQCWVPFWSQAVTHGAVTFVPSSQTLLCAISQTVPNALCCAVWLSPAVLRPLCACHTGVHKCARNTGVCAMFLLCVSVCCHPQALEGMGSQLL